MSAGQGRPLAPGDAVGFVGLGRMGIHMGSRLHDAGYRVVGYDVDPSARVAYERQSGGATVERLPEVSRGAAAVILMLPTSAVVSQVVVDGGLLDAMAEDSLLIDMGSSQPEVTQQLARTAEDRGVRLMDAPVSGGIKGAREGTLTIMAGGPEGWLHECGQMLDVLGRTILPVGPVGAGHALKALNNLLSAAHMLAASEAITIGTRFGLDQQTMLEVINGSSGKSWSTEMKFPTYVLNRSFESGFPLALLVKDTRIAVELARSTGVPAPHAEATLALWEQAAQELPPTADHTEIARWVEERSLGDRPR